MTTFTVTSKGWCWVSDLLTEGVKTCLLHFELIKPPSHRRPWLRTLPSTTDTRIQDRVREETEEHLQGRQTRALLSPTKLDIKLYTKNKGKGTTGPQNTDSNMEEDVSGKKNSHHIITASLHQ